MKEEWIRAAEIACHEHFGDRPMKHALEAYEEAKRADTAGIGALVEKVNEDIWQIAKIKDVPLGKPSKEVASAAERVMKIPNQVALIDNKQWKLICDAKTLAQFVSQYGGDGEP